MKNLKVSLKTKLIGSYSLIAIMLVGTLMFISNVILEQQFKTYVMHKQQKKNSDYVEAIQDEIDKGNDISGIALLALGQKALNDGIVLMVTDKTGQEIFCMSCYDNVKCEDMLNGMENTMRERYPNFTGEYTEERYPLYYNNENFAVVTLGFYGPFYYNDIDIEFIKVLNHLFMISGIFLISIAIIIGIIMANKISRPINKVINSTQKIRQGDYNYIVNTTSSTIEINDLVESVNALSFALQQEKEIKKRMASDYAHEIRTPLAVIQSNLEGIIDNVLPATPQRLESIRQEVLRLTRMVQDIDKIVETDNKNILNKVHFDLSNLTSQILTGFDTQIKLKNIKLDTKLNDVKIYADKDKISQVLVNLISNAIRYTDSGSIKIEVAKKDKLAFIIVEDTGIGIAEQDLQNIFLHLYRTDKSRARSTGGTGIGLSVVLSIIKAHNGDVLVESELNKGSKFTVQLPINEE